MIAIERFHQDDGLNDRLVVSATGLWYQRVSGRKMAPSLLRRQA